MTMATRKATEEKEEVDNIEVIGSTPWGIYYDFVFVSPPSFVEMQMSSLSGSYVHIGHIEERPFQIEVVSSSFSSFSLTHYHGPLARTTVCNLELSSLQCSLFARLVCCLLNPVMTIDFPLKFLPHLAALPRSSVSSMPGMTENLLALYD